MNREELWETFKEVVCSLVGHKWEYTDKRRARECKRCEAFQVLWKSRKYAVCQVKEEGELCEICNSEICLPKLHEEAEDVIETSKWI